MTKTTGHISELPLAPCASLQLEDPIRPELFQGQFEARPEKESGLTQFGGELRRSGTGFCFISQALAYS